MFDFQMEHIDYGKNDLLKEFDVRVPERTDTDILNVFSLCTTFYRFDKYVDEYEICLVVRIDL
jgi:hypothetical protein